MNKIIILLPIIKKKITLAGLFSDIENTDFQSSLLSAFNGENPDINLFNRDLAGLCLRCYISEAIVQECKRINYLYSGEKRFNYRDLLPFVLNDDGQNLIVLDKDVETQLRESLKKLAKKLEQEQIKE